MMLKTLAGAIAVAGLLATASVVPAAPAQPGPDNGHAWVLQNGQWVWSPQVNIRQSERYHSLVSRNRGFREARMRRECGPITDPDLHQRCLQSFAEYSPYGEHTSAFNTGGAPSYGSSAAPNYGTGYGR
jgi:hypothetical protein